MPFRSPRCEYAMSFLSKVSRYLFECDSVSLYLAFRRIGDFIERSCHFQVEEAVAVLQAHQAKEAAASAAAMAGHKEK